MQTGWLSSLFRMILCGMDGKSCFRVLQLPAARLPGQPSRQQTEFLAALHGLGAAGGSQLVKGAGAVRLDGVF